MYSRNDLIDALLRHLGPRLGVSRRSPYAPLPAPKPAGKALPLPPPGKKRFMTEFEVRKKLTPQTKVLTIPTDVIVSPLAQEWLALRGIRIKYSS